MHSTDIIPPRLALVIETPRKMSSYAVPCVLEFETISVGGSWVHGVAPRVNPFADCDPHGCIIGSIVYAIAEGGECGGTVEDWSAEFDDERVACFEGEASWRLVYNGVDPYAWADATDVEDEHAQSLADGLAFHLSTWRDNVEIDPSLACEPVELYHRSPADYSI